MTISETLQLLSPILQPLILFVAAMVTLLVTGGLKRIQAYLNAHDMAAAASAVADANAAIQPALMTSGTALATAVQAGTLPTTGPAWEAALQHELTLVKARVPDMLAVAKPLESGLLASIAQKANALLIASPTPSPTQQVAPAPVSPTDAVKAAGQTIADMRQALALVDKTAPSAMNLLSGQSAALVLGQTPTSMHTQAAPAQPVPAAPVPAIPAGAVPVYGIGGGVVGAVEAPAAPVVPTNTLAI